MSRKQAIKEIISIQNGDGVDMSNFPNGLKGSTAKSLWCDPRFSYGYEYGYMAALIKAFKIKKEELNQYE